MIKIENLFKAWLFLEPGWRGDGTPHEPLMAQSAETAKEFFSRPGLRNREISGNGFGCAGYCFLHFFTL